MCIKLCVCPSVFEVFLSVRMCVMFVFVRMCVTGTTLQYKRRKMHKDDDPRESSLCTRNTPVSVSNIAVRLCQVIRHVVTLLLSLTSDFPTASWT